MGCEFESFRISFNTGKLLNALLSGLSDRSASVRKSYATAIGHLVKVKSPYKIVLFVELLYVIDLSEIQFIICVISKIHRLFSGRKGQQRRETNWQNTELVLRKGR